MKAILVLCCCFALSAQAETFTAKVIAVMDGDTVMVLRDGQKLKVRMANIDAPEKDQPFGKQARDSLLEMIGKKLVQIDSRAVDQYGRIVGVISVDGRNVNQQQVKLGLAWEYSHYHSDKTYIGLQNDAQQARRGLWMQIEPQAPWQWRKLHPSVKTDTQINPSGIAAPVLLYDMACGKKRQCVQMDSCDEAIFYFSHCGVKTLDANHNGKPCENICNDKR